MPEEGTYLALLAGMEESTGAEYFRVNILERERRGEVIDFDMVVKGNGQAMLLLGCSRLVEGSCPQAALCSSQKFDASPQNDQWNATELCPTFDARLSSYQVSQKDQQSVNSFLVDQVIGRADFASRAMIPSG